MGEKARRSRILLRISPIISIGSLQQKKNKVMLFCLFKLSQIRKISIFTYKHKTHNQMKNIKEFYSLETWGIGLTKRTLSSMLSNMFSSQFTYSSFAPLRWLAMAVLLDYCCIIGSVSEMFRLRKRQWKRTKTRNVFRQIFVPWPERQNENQDPDLDLSKWKVGSGSGFVKIKSYFRIKIRQFKSRIRI